MNKHWTLYVLKLEQDKWYVGITSQSVEKRYIQHKSGFAGARWTKKYEPVKIHYIKDLGECDLERAQLYEGRVTRKYMEEYGDNNVRGGDLTDEKDYVRRFGYFFDKEGWKDVMNIVIILLVLGALMIDKFIISFIPGGVQ